MKKYYLLTIIIISLCFINVHALECRYTTGDVNSNGIYNEIKIYQDESNGINYQAADDGDKFNVTSVVYQGSFSNLSMVCPSDLYYYIVNQTIFITDQVDHYNNAPNTAVSKGHLPLSKVEKKSKSSGNICLAIGSFKDFFENSINKPIKIISVILFVVMSSVEYAKTIFSTEPDFKKVNNRTLKRVGALLVLFFSNELIKLIYIVLGFTIC